MSGVDTLVCIGGPLDGSELALGRQEKRMNVYASAARLIMSYERTVIRGRGYRCEVLTPIEQEEADTMQLLIKGYRKP